MSGEHKIMAGRPYPIGATFDGEGVNFAVFSAHATKIELCLFAEDGLNETHRIPLPERNGDVWHGHVAGLFPGQLYGFRVHGPFEPSKGHRFNPNKLLVDPYAKRLVGQVQWHPSLMGYATSSRKRDLSFDKRDSAPFVPKASVEDPTFSWGDVAPLAKPVSESIIYETHVKGLTQRHPDVTVPGTFLGLASDPMLDHFNALGITAVELLPSQAFVNDQFLVNKNLVNYWGYQTLGFFAPEPRYLSQGRIREFQIMVSRLHSAGIEVIMDVVYNHTCEGNELGPTLSFRGLDNKNYYRLAEDQRFYINDTGTGNTLNLEHPMILRMVMDSLRYWVEVMHVDGFRFDLCSTLGRRAHGFDPSSGFFAAIRQDPVLAGVKLIAEPWDIGPGGYRLGAFPPPFMEWNDKYRDTVRRFWRGDADMARRLSDRLTGSARQFDHSGRPATSSVNFLAAHDGFTLADVVSYRRKHNEANGERSKDGHGENFSDNMGVEGPTDDPTVNAARKRRRRNMMATLMLSQGTPMVLSGDELGHSQDGNNNAYNQDNPTTWIDWANVEAEFLKFTRQMIAFRKAHPILRQNLFLHSRERSTDGLEDLFWHREDGTPMQEADWKDHERKILCAEMRMASGSPNYAEREDAVFAVFNAGPEIEVVLPAPPEGKVWFLHVDTNAKDDVVPRICEATYQCPSDSVLAFVLEQSP
ncbi:MAG: glycogen debranching protein GlgX [Silicimonas sp.]|nr:glycogen debranching protein GlgX [Silicimonas sp.]